MCMLCNNTGEIMIKYPDDFEIIPCPDCFGYFIKEEQVTRKQFIERIFELAFGANAINRGYTFNQVADKIEEFSDNALNWENLFEDLQEEL